MSVTTYLNSYDQETRAKLLPIVDYINKNFPSAKYSDTFSPKTLIPTWLLNESYVAFACKKNYISIYFGSLKAVETVKALCPNIPAGKGCFNIKYNINPFPHEAIFQGIDMAFKKP